MADTDLTELEALRNEVADLRRRLAFYESETGQEKLRKYLMHYIQEDGPIMTGKLVSRVRSVMPVVMTELDLMERDGLIQKHWTGRFYDGSRVYRWSVAS